MVENFACTDWLVNWKPSGQSLFAKQEIFCSAVFSNKFFHLKQLDTLRVKNAKGILLIALKFGQ